MKKLLVVSAIAVLGLTSVAFAGGLPEEMPAAPAAVASSDAGVYVGIQGGWGMTHYKDALNVLGNSINIDKDNGFVGRAVLGYDINRYFAIEGGYSYFFNKVTFNDEGNIKTQAADLYFKGKLPVVDNFDLYAKLGAGWLFAKADGDSDLSKRDNINVAFGAGADYYITPNVIANIEWSRIAGNSKFGENYIPNTDAFMVGLRYKFDL